MRISPSQISLFDAARGGCPRAWWYRYVGKLPQKPSKGKDFGDRLHKELEDYLLGKFPAESLSAHAQAGLKYLPTVGSSYAVELQGWQLEIGDVVLNGRIDLFDYENREIIDHKSTKDIVKYAKGAHQLLDDPQCIIYLAYAYSRLPTSVVACPDWTFRHIYYQSTTPASATVAITIEREENAEALAHLVAGPCQGILEASKIPKPADVTCNEDACMRFGGCDFASACPDSPLRRHTVDVFDFLKPATPPAPAQAKPAPVSAPAIAPPDAPKAQAAVLPSPAPDLLLPAAPPPPTVAPVQGALPLAAESIAPPPAPAKRGPGRPRKIESTTAPAAAPQAAPPPSPTVQTPPEDLSTAEKLGKPAGAFVLCINCIPVDGEFTDLGPYVRGVAQKLAEKVSAPDIRLSETFAYSKWKGALAAAITGHPPFVSTGVLLTDGDEFAQVAVGPLSEMASLVIRGLR